MMLDGPARAKRMTPSRDGLGPDLLPTGTRASEVIAMLPN
jgi:hypothetical protein